MYRTGINPEEDHKIFYDSLPSGYPDSYPANAVRYSNIGQRHCPKVIDNWNTVYSRCKWQVFNATTGRIVDNLIFPTLADFVSWKNVNISHDTLMFNENIILRPYDFVKDTLPCFDKLYGVNTLYMSMRGRAHYESGVPHMGAGNDKNWGASILKSLYDYQFPFISPFITVTDFDSSLGGRGRNACWCAGNNKRVYASPNISFPITISSTSSDRYVGCSNWENFNLVVPTKVFTFSGITVKPAIAIYRGGATDMFDSQVSGDIEAVKFQLLAYPDARALMFFGLEEIHSVGQDYVFAVLIKPLGIDRVWLNYVDTSIYDIEVVYIVPFEQKSWFYKIDSVHLTRATTQKDAIGVERTGWGSGLVKYAYENETRTMFCPIPDIYFRVREKSTGLVGRLSRAKVRAFLHRKLAPIKFLVV